MLWCVTFVTRIREQQKDKVNSSQLTQLFQWGWRGWRQQTGRGSPSWSAVWLGRGSWRGCCPPENTSSPHRQQRQTGHLGERTNTITCTTCTTQAVPHDNGTCAHSNTTQLPHWASSYLQMCPDQDKTTMYFFSIQSSHLEVIAQFHVLKTIWFFFVVFVHVQWLTLFWRVHQLGQLWPEHRRRSHAEETQTITWWQTN